MIVIEAKASSKRLPNVSVSSLGEPEMKCAYETKPSSLYRRNVLDLIELFGGRAQKAHLLCDVDMSRIEDRRAKLAASGHHLTVTSFLLKAISIAQESHPISRTLRLPLGRTVTFNDVVAGFTVERLIDGEPFVFFGEIDKPCKKTLIEIAEELRQYSDLPIDKVAVLNRQKRFAEWPAILRQVILHICILFPSVRLSCNSATFGLSSLGAMGVKTVIGPSVCTSVFGVGAVELAPVVRDGEIVIRSIMSLSLNYDQDVMDGAQAARFLQEARNLLESCPEDVF